MKKIVFFVFLLFSFQLVIAQNGRKAWLGAQLQPSPAKDKQPEGLLIVQTVGGSSVELKMLSGDILTALNGNKITSDAQTLRGILGNMYEDQDLTASVFRNGKSLTLKGKAKGRPKETDDNAEVIYDYTPYRNGQLRTVINKPFKTGKMPAMLFVPGYTCSPIEGLDDSHPYKRVIDAFVDAGYVTLRIEKPGLGDSYGTQTCEECDLNGEIEGFEKGLLKLKSLPYVDTTQIIIFGHSMGGVVAPVLASKHKVQGVIVYGTTAKQWFEYQLEMNRLQTILAKPDPMELEAYCKQQTDIAHDFYVKRKSLKEIAANSQYAELLKTTWEWDGANGIYSRNGDYWRQIDEQQLIDKWKNIKADVLVLYGDADFQAFSRQDHEQIVYTVNYYQPGRATFVAFKDTEHNFAKLGNMQTAFDVFASGDYQRIFDSFNFEVTNKSVEWAQSLSGKADATPALQWRKASTEVYGGKQDDICFINRNEGWYVNGYGKIYHTKDGGKTWEKQLEKQGTFFRCIAFIDEKTGFAGTVGTDYFPNVTDTIPMYRTTDGGKTWSAVDYKGPYVKGLCAIDIVKEPFINHGVTDYKYHIYAVGRVGTPANMMVSHDGGKTFESWSMESFGAMLFDIDMFDTKNGIACSASSGDLQQSNALILKTSDGGKTWKKVYQSTRPMETTWKSSFPSEKIGYVTIQSYNPDQSVKQQRVAKTEDGGETWKEINLCEDATAREFGIGFIDDNHGYVGTMNSGYETKDGGKTWEKIDLGRACNKIRIYSDEKGIYGASIGVDVFILQ